MVILYQGKKIIYFLYILPFFKNLLVSRLVNIVRLYFHSCLLSSVNYCNDGFYSFLDLLFSYNEYDFHRCTVILIAC